jgi:hypothetical protein
MAVQSVMDQNAHQFHLEESERCQDHCEFTRVTSAKLSIEEYRSIHCTQLCPEKRPALFPEELWPLVMDSQKDVVRSRWDQYSADRLVVVMKGITDVMISNEGESRKLDIPLFKAQLYANIDRFGHPDPSNPPRIKGVKFEIKLEEGAIPIHSKPRRMPILERMCLAARVYLMMSNKMIQRSSSNWTSPVNLVPYPERINAFLEQYKGEAGAKLSDPTLRSTVAALYRLTGDFRQVNNLTILETYPLPRIADILDRMRDKDRYSTGDIEDAFFTVEITEESKKFTAFQTPDGCYEYNVMA